MGAGAITHTTERRRDRGDGVALWLFVSGDANMSYPQPSAMMTPRAVNFVPRRKSVFPPLMFHPRMSKASRTVSITSSLISLGVTKAKSTK